MQRQYVETFMVLLVVVISADLQNGQAFGATMASVDWVCTRITQPCDCVAMAHQWSPRGKRSQSLCLPTRSVAHARSGGGLGSAPHTAIR